MSIEMVIPTRNKKIFQPNTYEPDRENSILDSDSDLPDLEDSYENYENTSQFIQRSPQVIRHVVQFKAPEYEANTSAGNKKFSIDAWRAAMQRREVKKEKAKDKTSTNGTKENLLKTSHNLKSEATREISGERSGKFSKLFRKSLYSDGVSCNTCNTDSASVRSDSFTESGGGSKFISRLSPFSSRLSLSRRSKSFDSIGSSSRRGNRKWRKWWKNKREQSPEKKSVFVKETPQTSPVDVSNFIEYSNIEAKETRSNWLCASMEPVILCKDYFCATEEDELTGTEYNKSSGILRNSTRNHVRFESDHNKNHD